MTRSTTAIWHVPLAVLAGLTAIAGIGLSFVPHALPAPYGAVLPLGFGSAALTFVIARIWTIRSVTRRELELLVLAIGCFVGPKFAMVAAVVLAVGLAFVVWDEFGRLFGRAVAPPRVQDHTTGPTAPPRHELDDED